MLIRLKNIGVILLNRIPLKVCFDMLDLRQLPLSPNPLLCNCKQRFSNDLIPEPDHFEHWHHKRCLCLIEIDLIAFENPKVIHFEQIGLKDLHVVIVEFESFRTFPKPIVTKPVFLGRVYCPSIFGDKIRNIVMVFFIYLLL